MVAASNSPAPAPPASSTRTSPLHLTSNEINVLVHTYLLESNLAHSAFTFALEAKLASLPDVGRKIPRGELLRWLHRGLAWQEVEAHVGEDGPLPPCSSPFSLLTPHVCVPILPSTPSPSLSHLPLPSTQQPITLSIASSSTVPPPTRPELFPEPDETSAFASAASIGSSSAKGKRKAVNGSGGGEKNLDVDDETGSVGERSTGSRKDESGGSSSKRPRVEKEKKEDTDTKMSVKVVKAPAPKPLPLPSFQRKSTINSSSTTNPPRPSSSSSSTASSSKPTSPSTTFNPLPGSSTSNAASSSSTSNNTLSSTKKSNSTTTSPTLPSSRSLASTSSTTTGTSQKKKKPSSSSISSSTLPSSSSLPAFVDKAPGEDFTKTITTLSLSLEASPDGSSSSEEGDASKAGAAGKGKRGKKDKKGGKGKVRIFGGEHNGEVFVCKFSPVQQSGGGEVLATGAGDATVRVWEFQPPGAPGSADPEGWSMEDAPAVCRHLPVTDRKDITSIDFNPPGTLIGTASYDGIARLWTPEGELHGVLTRHSGAIFCLKFNPTGSLLATAGSDGSVCVWEAASARLRQAYEFHADCTLDVDWLDDETLASCSMDKTIIICRVGLNIPYRSFRGHTDEVNRVAWSPAPPSANPSSSSGSSASTPASSAGRVLASCSDDATVRIWGLDLEPSTLSSDDGAFQNGRLEKYCKGVLRGHEKEIYTFAFAPTTVGSSSDIPILATASFDQTVRLWDISSLTCLRVLRAHTETVFSISFSPSGRHLASAGWDKLMVIWETETGKPVRHRAGEAGIFELEWSKNAGVVAVCQSDKSVVLVDVKELE